MELLKKLVDSFNFAEQCRRYRVKLWQCPQFLFLILGVFIIFAILLTNNLAKRYVGPEVVALVVLFIATILFIISFFIVSSFERIAESSAAKSDFISIMSHHLRNPLSSTKWLLNVLASKKIDLSNEETETSLKEIKLQNEHMIGLVNDLLDINRIEDNAVILNPSSFSLKELTENVLASYSDMARVVDVDVVFLAQDGLPYVFADKEKIKNVVSHLIDNAIRYSIRKSKVSITIEKLSGAVRFVINDEGVGISDEETEKIFNKFFRTQSSMRYKTSGAGLGLFIAKEIVSMSGGKMGFTSLEGKGSTFWFTLPLSLK